MSTTEPPDRGLLDAADPYALDGITALGRDAVEQRRDHADRFTAARFDAAAAAALDALAVLSTVDSRPAPPQVRDRLLRALEQATRSSAEPGPAAIDDSGSHDFGTESDRTPHQT